MDDAALVALMYHVDMQCRIVLQSSTALDDTLAQHKREFEQLIADAADESRERRPLGPRGTSTAYCHLQCLLGAAANISKALWGVADKSGRTASEREPLRTALGVTDHSILKQRTVRDCFEHYDERVIKWVALNPGRGFSDCNIAPWSPTAGEVFFRHFNERTRIVTGVDQNFNQFHLSIAEVVDEVRGIVSRSRFS